MSLNEHVHDTLRLIDHTLGDKIAVKRNLAADLWPTEADPEEVDSALLNFAFNARDAMPDGGEFLITTRNVSLDRDAVADVDASPGDYAVLSVTDTGVGMSPETSQRAMEPFFTTKRRGTGLGLSGVFGFAKHSGGFVRIESRLGAGATISLFLPRAPAGSKNAETPSRELVETPYGDGELVLVVEDNDHIREVTLQRLEALGYAVLEARTGPEAIALLEAGEPVDLVFSDVAATSRMTGYDLARWLRAHRPEIGIALASGYAAGKGAPAADRAMNTSPCYASPINSVISPARCAPRCKREGASDGLDVAHEDVADAANALDQNAGSRRAVRSCVAGAQCGRRWCDRAATRGGRKAPAQYRLATARASDG